jgi:AmmeMemoRadiSam system protein B
MNTTESYRNMGVAGAFYSHDKFILERELSMLLEAAPVLDLPRTIRAIISPHAGYLYSGGVAARAYSQIINAKYQKVIVIAPTHKDSYNFSSIYDGLGYKTPLGEITVERSDAQKLTEFHKDIRFSSLGHSAEEHSLEVQLPFLQWCLRKFKFIPISMGNQDLNSIKILSEALSQIIKEDNALIVASSDLSHMHPDHQARTLDQVAMDDISKFDENKLWDDIQSGKTEMCGYGPVITAMRTAKLAGAKESKILIYRNSGDISGDHDKVVGYLSAIIY